MNSTKNTVYQITEWITRFAYLNLLWVVFTLAGAIVLGLFPATTAMFSVCRKWLRGQTDVPVFRTFWDYYRKDFAKSNVMGLVVWLLLALIAADVFYLLTLDADHLTWTSIPLFAFMLLVALFLFYLFPTFVHFDIRVPQVLKNAFLIMLIHPLHSLLILLCLVSLFLIMQALPALAFIFGASSYAFITMWISLNAFNKTTAKTASSLPE
ncbi:YesL family protein [Planococcus ruber]|uniref:YesL family protein n=1 Tax=Planococcus ruber TaxID=2027871 RepID=UPI001FEDF4D7|nr:YesL family protein [Planococcus ruber]MCJ1909851.1 YesL family protein [Planococcus ruber]